LLLALVLVSPPLLAGGALLIPFAIAPAHGAMFSNQECQRHPSTRLFRTGGSEQCVSQEKRGSEAR